MVTVIWNKPHNDEGDRWGDPLPASDHYWCGGPEADGTWSASCVVPLFDEDGDYYENEWRDVGLRGFADEASMRRAVMQYEREHQAKKENSNA